MESRRGGANRMSATDTEHVMFESPSSPPKEVSAEKEEGAAVREADGSLPEMKSAGDDAGSIPAASTRDSELRTFLI